MGIFTNACTNPACGHRVRKGSTFCPKCGNAAPGGLTKCGSCKAEVSTASKFCYRCGADLKLVARPYVLDDRWARRPGDLAVRVESQDLRRFNSSALRVEHGTRALFFQGGAFRGELAEGSYETGGLFNRLFNFVIDQAATVILVDAGDISLDLENGKLWSSDRIELGAVTRLVVHVAAPDAIYVNLLKGRGQVDTEDLESSLAGEVQMVMEGIVARYTAQQLIEAVEARALIESQLRAALASTLSRLGLELIQLRFISFVGAAYDELRQQQAADAAKARALQRDAHEAELVAQRNELQQRLRASLTQEKMDSFKTEKDLEDFIRQTEHELGLKQVIRGDEMERLRQRLAFDRDREGILRRIEIENIVGDEARQRAWKALLAQEQARDETHRRALERRLAEVRNEAEAEKIRLEIVRLKHTETMRQAEAGMAILRQTKEIEAAEDKRRADAAAEKARLDVQLEKERLEARGKASIPALLSIIDGPAAERLAHLEELRIKQGFTPEQILAFTAKYSPEAARALAARYTAEGRPDAVKAEMLEKLLADQKQQDLSFMDRLERLSQLGMQRMVDVAGVSARGGSAVVIQAPAVASPACRHCAAGMGSDDRFCSACGKAR